MDLNLTNLQISQMPDCLHVQPYGAVLYHRDPQPVLMVVVNLLFHGN